MKKIHIQHFYSLSNISKVEVHKPSLIWSLKCKVSSISSISTLSLLPSLIFDSLGWESNDISITDPIDKLGVHIRLGFRPGTLIFQHHGYKYKAPNALTTCWLERGFSVYLGKLEKLFIKFPHYLNTTPPIDSEGMAMTHFMESTRLLDFKSFSQALCCFRLCYVLEKL